MGYLKTKTHISWVITAWCLGFLLGVAAARPVTELGVNSIILLTAGLVLTLVVATSRLRLILPIAVIAGGLLGVVRCNAMLADLARYHQLVGDDVRASGVVADDPSMSRGKIALSLTDVAIYTTKGEKFQLRGKIWVAIKAPSDMTNSLPKRSDRVIVDGVLDNGFGAYAATVSNAKLVDDHRIAGADPLGELRNDFGGHLSQVLDKTETGLGMGLLAGQKTTLGSDIQKAFVAASLTHILVASGYNLTVLIRFARRLLAKHSRLVALILSGTLVLAFAGVTGASASMSRAVVVAILSLLLWYVGRKIHPVVLLAVSSALTIMIEPSQLWGDVGWYLSFGSFAGVIILAPLLNDWLAGRASGWLGSLIQVLVETLSAQLMTWTMIAVFMSNVSLVGLITNVLVLPWLPLAMALTFMAGLAVYLLPLTLAIYLARPAKLLLDGIIGVAEWGATLPGSSLAFQPNLTFVAIYYALVLLLILLLRWRTGHNFYGDNVIE